jgi:hypothetical protein
MLARKVNKRERCLNRHARKRREKTVTVADRSIPRRNHPRAKETTGATRAKLPLDLA